MTLVDVHMRDEQLPFGYFFHETLDASELEASLSRVLRRYAPLGGRANLLRGTIDCHPGDSVSLSFGKTDRSLRQWLNEAPPQRLHRGRRRPSLSPLFDCLEEGRADNNNNNNRGALASVKVTYFEGGGTALGVNFSHALADAASCVRFVQCWGRDMRGLPAHPDVSNERARATCSGMLSPALLELLNLERQNKAAAAEEEGPRSYIGEWLSHFGMAEEWTDEPRNQQEHELMNDNDNESHEYVPLKFSRALLQAMKAHGMAHSRGTETGFVSTNDMISAFGWLMKRQLAEQPEYNMSMVINLRGRCGVEDFGNICNPHSGLVVVQREGVFGNGITNVVATMPCTSSGTHGSSSSSNNIALDDVSDAAIAIRAALTAGILDIPDRLLRSRSGRAAAAPSSADCFALTSWLQFPLFDISFSSDATLAAFRGHPTHRMPRLAGDTFSSVIVPRKCGGHTYLLLAPSRKVEEAKSLHRRVCLQFLEWHEKEQATRACD